MSKYSYVFLLLLFPLISTKADVPQNKQIVEKVVALYQAETVSRFGRGIALSFHNSDILQATGGHVPTGPEITVFRGILDRLSAEEILFIVCHELGHILGYVNFVFLNERPPGALEALNAVEGEADYFGGACVREYFLNNAVAHIEAPILSKGFFSLIEQSAQAVRGALEAIYKRKIDETLAQDIAVGQALTTYPPAECRLLTALRGIENLPRPACWYNR